MTSDRGASEQEEETAKAKIELLKSKNKENNSKVPEFEVVGIIPAHEANPPLQLAHRKGRCYYIKRIRTFKVFKR